MSHGDRQIRTRRRSSGLMPLGPVFRPIARPAGVMLAALALLTGLPGVSSAGDAARPPEPDGYRMEDYRQPTPATLRGVRVVKPEEAFALWRSRAAIFIDVMPRSPKPANLAPGTIWRDKPHSTIPGAAWLPNVGYGRLAAETDAYFRRSLETLTAGDKARAVLFFCLADCWMSWNAAKRAREEYGYLQVIWFPEGSDGWVFPDADAGLVEATPFR